MLKPGSLRDQLTAAIPQLKTDPSKLSITSPPLPWTKAAN